MKAVWIVLSLAVPTMAQISFDSDTMSCNEFGNCDTVLLRNGSNNEVYIDSFAVRFPFDAWDCSSDGTALELSILEVHGDETLYSIQVGILEVFSDSVLIEGNSEVSLVSIGIVHYVRDRECGFLEYPEDVEIALFANDGSEVSFTLSAPEGSGVHGFYTPSRVRTPTRIGRIYHNATKSKCFTVLGRQLEFNRKGKPKTAAGIVFIGTRNSVQSIKTTPERWITNLDATSNAFNRLPGYVRYYEK